VPAEVDRYLELFSSLVASPLRKFRLSSIYASLLITVSPPLILSATTWTPNIASGLGQVLKSEVLHTLLLHEFNNKHLDDVGMLESALSSVILEAESYGVENIVPFDEKLRTKGGLRSAPSHGDHLPTVQDGTPFAKVKILQGQQAHWGKLKERKQDFLNRSLALSDDCWAALIK
jgi:hypothetical protein